MVRGLSTEDELGVPEMLRSGTSRFRSDMRLRRGRTREAERMRRDSAAAARALAIRMARLHARLEDLINREGDRPRYWVEYFSDTAPQAGSERRRPTDLQLAILGGLVIEGTPPTVAGIRGVNSIVARLAEELPGFGIQYDIAYEHERDRITSGYLTDLVLAVIDMLDVLIPLGVVVAIAGRRAFRQALTAIRRAGRRETAELALDAPGARTMAAEEAEHAWDLQAEAIQFEPESRGMGPSAQPTETYSVSGAADGSDQFLTRSGSGRSHRSESQGTLSEHIGAETTPEHAQSHVDQYRELSGGLEPPPHGRDGTTGTPGATYATHAELQNFFNQVRHGTNHPIGVTRDMCGSCRRFFQRAARQTGRRIPIADENFLRVFQPDGSVDICVRGSTTPIQQVPPMVEPSVTPTGSYEGIPW
jgi:hypothetical protein